MKTAIRSLKITLTLFGLMCTMHLAQAFYMAEAGRWINRDPHSLEAGRLPEFSESNLYRFLKNSSLTWIDPDGCDTMGAGGFVPPPPGTELGSTDCTQSPPVPSLGPAGKALPKSVQSCILAHEAVHVASDCSRGYCPAPCTGLQCLFVPLVERLCGQLYDEARAWMAGASCAQAALADPGLSPTDRAALQWYMTDQAAAGARAFQSWQKACR